MKNATLNDPIQAPKSKSDIAQQLRWLSERMLDVATSMDYYGGFAEWSEHAGELAIASAIVNQWADEIDAEEVTA